MKNYKKKISLILKVRLHHIWADLYRSLTVISGRMKFVYNNQRMSCTVNMSISRKFKLRESNWQFSDLMTHTSFEVYATNIDCITIARIYQSNAFIFFLYFSSRAIGRIFDTRIQYGERILDKGDKRVKHSIRINVCKYCVYSKFIKKIYRPQGYVLERFSVTKYSGFKNCLRIKKKRYSLKIQKSKDTLYMYTHT